MKVRPVFVIVLLVVILGVYLLKGKKIFLKRTSDAVRIQRIAEAIATQEGFFVKGSVPARNHNPGDLRLDTIGRATGRDNDFVIYKNDSDGWDALREQVRLMLTGESRFYGPELSIAEVAAKYAPGPQAVGWANGVARKLGVPITTLISEV